ncbi:Hypothetical protein I596_387 [Dokdonella koreensis DS-123]|uniref:Uncharacterized protein n=1 Tax=Dokdonella koreensis DS-123 TaxID=1300342 RepID=A0A167GCZ2_9GAMM|nr:Hypothetical protein I596_387 [Dokdonella koreensis DS-123]
MADSHGRGSAAPPVPRIDGTGRRCASDPSSRSRRPAASRQPAGRLSPAARRQPRRPADPPVIAWQAMVAGFIGR